MATYNGSKFIQEQLDSFVNQTRLPDELVVSDDVSSDDTIEKLESFAASAPFDVRIYRNERNLGYAGNFNNALKHTTGDLVFLSDQDDVWFPEKIQRLEAEAENSDALVIMNDAALTDEDLNVTGLTKIGQIQSGGLSDSSFVMGCCAAVKRELLNFCLPVPDHFPAHDSWIIMMAEGMNRKQIIPDVLQWYRRHKSNESQFIANRIVKITRWAKFWHGISNLFKGSHLLESDYQSKNAEQFILGVLNAQKKTNEPFSSELLAFAKKLISRQINFTQRLNIRALPRIRRLMPALKLYRCGGYNRFSGIKSLVRDIIFR